MIIKKMFLSIEHVLVVFLECGIKQILPIYFILVTCTMKSFEGIKIPQNSNCLVVYN